MLGHPAARYVRCHLGQGMLISRVALRHSCHTGRQVVRGREDPQGLAHFNQLPAAEAARRAKVGSAAQAPAAALAAAQPRALPIGARIPAK